MKHQNNEEIIYIRGYRGATGGYELLHQLCHNLNKFGCSAIMFFDKQDGSNPIHEFYAHYNNPYTFKIIDEKKNILIVPEVEVAIPYMYKKIQMIYWWLSVDNYYISYKANIDSRRFGRYFKINSFFKKKMHHMFQSTYAHEFLIKNKIDVNKLTRLSDYLSSSFLDCAGNTTSLKNRKNIVLYNPKKGIEFTKKIIDYDISITYIPLVKMTPAQIRSLMLESKVYIDFGFHPGKDRLPREATLCGCCIITGLDGSAKNDIDVPIDPEFKIAAIEKNIPLAVDKIKEIFNQFDEMSEKFNSYRELIKKEKHLFEKDVLELINKIKTHTL